MSKKNPSQIKLYVRRLDTREIVHTVVVKNPYWRKAEKIMRGMLINMDTDRFYIDDDEADELE